MLVDMERFVVECEVTLDSTPEKAKFRQKSTAYSVNENRF